MATLLRTCHFLPSLSTTTTSTAIPSLNSSSLYVSFKAKSFYAHISPFILSYPLKNPSFLAFSGEATETQHPDVQDDKDALDNETTKEEVIDDSRLDADESPTSQVITALQLYKEALTNNDESKIAELEAFFKSIEDEKYAFERKVASLSQELSVERDRVLRISADFDNYRKRTERERASLVTNAKGEVIENFLPVLDNFERAKSQIKVESQTEEKINNSYQSIYKQFVELLGSIGIVPVETVGNPFDPLLHEAIMREESTEYDEGIVIEEYRKGFKLGDRLLRPSMVKVSAGPGPQKPEATESLIQEESLTNDSQDVSEGVDS